MKIRDGFVRQEVMGEICIVPTGAAGEVIKGLVKLNATGDFIWRRLEEGQSEEAIAEKLVEEYEVTKESALADVKVFIQKMKDANIFE